MRRNLIAGLALMSLTLLPPSRAQAQAYKSSVGWTAGVLSTTSMNDGAGGAGDVVSIEPNLAWTAGAHYDYWFGGNVGIRGQGAFSRQEVPWTQGDRVIYAYSADASLLLRPLAPEPGRPVLPYLFGGVGGSLWKLGRGDPTTFGAAAATYGGKETVKLLLPVGIGIDFITPWNWGEGPLVIRIEGRDHIQLKSPFDPVDPDQGDFGMIHNFGVVLGFHTGVGLLGGGY